MKNLLVAQSGGPTAAINATLAGVISNAITSEKIGKIYGAVNGIQGVLEERLIDLAQYIKNTMDLELMCMTPSSALGSCRLKLNDNSSDETEIRKIISVMQKYDIGYFVYIGGNDSMDTVYKLSKYCEKKQIKGLNIMGAPKTIDNDLVGTDHCPGFGSAAKYIATTFAELERDCSVYQTKAVTIVEVMGRNAGWLTAASALSRINGGKGPDLIYLCESPFEMDIFLQDVKNKLSDSNSVLIAVSEGIKDRNGVYISEQVQNGDTDAFGHNYIAGAAKVLENSIRINIGCKVRSIELNLMQRCAAHIRSSVDIQESKMLGAYACQCAIEENSGFMVGTKRIRNVPYQVECTMIPIEEVANRERCVPISYISDEKNNVTKEMLDYLFPLIQGEEFGKFQNGIPQYWSIY